MGAQGPFADPILLSGLATAGAASLLALGVLGALVSRRPLGTRLTYGACALVCAALACLALLALLNPDSGPAFVRLSVGLPLGHTLLGLDPVSAAFAVIVNLTSALVSAYGGGYGVHAREPQRVVPFYPAFIGGMNLVLLAQDAFSF